MATMVRDQLGIDEIVVHEDDLELPADGRAVRCGRFRITRSSVSARTVQFETKPTTRVRITVLGEDDDA